MQYVKIVLLTFASLLLLSCKSEHFPVEPETCVLQLPIREQLNVQPGKLSDLISEIEYVVLDSSDPEMIIGGVGQIQLVDNCLYVSDVKSESLLRFSLDGRFISKLSCRGRGPGEYISFACYDVNRKNGNVSVLDISSRAVNVYDSENDFLYKFNLTDIPRDMAVLDNGDYLFCTFDYMRGVRRGIWQTDSVGVFKKSITADSHFYFCSGFHPNSFFHLSNEVCIAGNEEFDYLYHIGNDGYKVAYKINTGLSIPPELRKRKVVDVRNYRGKIYTKMAYYETSSFMTITGTDLIQSTTLYHAKESGRNYYFSSAGDMVNDLGKPIGPITSCYEDGFIGIIQPSAVNLEDECMRAFFPDINSNSNPVIVLMKTN